MFSSNTSQQSEGYQIQRSLRFNSADSAYLNRTFGTPTANLTWTLSLWVKLTALSTYRTILSAGTTEIGFSNGNAIWLVAGATTNTSTAIYRDPSAWGHLVISSNGTTMNAYWNNSNVLSAAMTMPQINSAAAHTIGKYAPISADLFDGYMTEVNFIDGQALTPSSFGQTNANTGVWEPKPYAGTYGTNGFYLNFSDNSNTTATTLGKDYSGNGNNWTPNNFSVSAGAGNDSLVDVPTAWGTDTGVGGTVRGNYATLNPLQNPNGVTLSNGNLDMVTPNNAITGLYGTIGVSSGKWYWEFTQTAFTLDGAPRVGIANNIGGTFWTYNWDATKQTGGTRVSYGATFTNNDVIGVALDVDSGTLTFYKNGASQGTAYTGLAAGTYFPLFWEAGTVDTYTANINFGQRPFAYTAPSGFKALCTQNLPTPTIGATASTQAGKFFNPVIYTAPVNSSTLTVTGVGFQPDFTWWKTRSASDSNTLMNVLSGSDKYLLSNSTNAEATFSGIWTPTSDGFTASALSYSSNQTYVAWNWKANGAGVTNTAGSITSTVSANTTSGFSVVTFTGNGGTASTVGHGLGSAPKFIIQKRRNDAGGWNCYHASLPVDYRIDLNTTAAATYDPGAWNSTAPTSSVYSIQNPGNTNISGATYVAYCFAEVQGFSKAFSYTGNGSADGAFVFTGMRPAYVLLKRTDTTSNWTVLDFKRLGYNVDNNPLYPNLSDAEGTTDLADLLSNGFKLRSTDASVNASGGTYIGFAFAESPFKYALAR